MADQNGCASVFVRAGWKQVILFDEEGFAGDGYGCQWCEPFIEGDDMSVVFDGNGFAVAPQGGRPVGKCVNAKFGLKAEVKEASAGAAPLQGVGATGFSTDLAYQCHTIRLFLVAVARHRPAGILGAGIR